MPSYRVGRMVDRDGRNHTRHSLVCEACNKEIGTTVLLGPGQDKFSGMTVAGVVRLWPGVEKELKLHEGNCRPVKPGSP
jgi:hypothetical protein